MKSGTKILSEVILGLELLHKMGYIHRDIKPQNILLKKNKDGNFVIYFLFIIVI
jgi:serine/threonine protein kinase